MFQESARPANRKVSTVTSASDGASPSPTQATHPSSSAISNHDICPRRGSSEIRPDPPPVAATPAMALLVHTEHGRALLSEQAVWTEDHHEQEQEEEKQLSEGRRDIIAADRLHNAD